jgi:hypothetical protein
MSISSGYSQTAYFGDESKYGSAAAINQPFGLVQSVNPTETNNLIKIRTMGGTRDFSNVVPGKFEVSGSIEFYLQHGSPLRLGIGEDTGTTSGAIDGGPRTYEGTTYMHVMGSAASPAAECFPSFTLEFADDQTGECLGTSGANNLKRVYTGCRVNNMSVSASVDEPLSVSMDWQAQGVQISTAGPTSVVELTVDPYVFYQGAVYATSGNIAGDTAITSADAIAAVNSFDFSINNNLEAVWHIGGTTAPYQNLRGLKHLVPKGREYDANLNLHFENKAMYERFLGATGATGPQTTLNPYQIVFDFVRSGKIGTKVHTDDYMRVVMRNCKFDNINIAGSPEDIVTQTIAVFVGDARTYFVDSDSSYRE